MNSYIPEMNRLRGFGILLVVLGHSIFIDMIHTTDVSTVGFFTYLRSFIYSFHMPLFFLISGFFALKAFNIKKVQDYYDYISNKFKKLMIPYFVLSIIAIAIKLVLSSYAARPVDISTIVPTILLYPWENALKILWYVYTLFFIFAIVPLLNKIPLHYKLGGLFILTILPLTYGEIFNLDGIIRYLFYFYLGASFAQNYDKFLRFQKKHLLLLVGTIILLIINTINMEDSMFYHAFNLLKALLGIASSITFIYILKNNVINVMLDYLGKYSYEIYLLHWFAQMPISLLYQQFKFNYHYLVLISFFAAFLVIPITKYIY